MTWIWTIAWAYIKSWMPSLPALLNAVPKEVWFVVLGVCAFLYYGHYSREQGYTDALAHSKALVVAEQQRLTKEFQKVLDNDQKRAEAAEMRLAQLEKDAKDVVEKARTARNGTDVCIDAATARRLQRL